MADVFHWCKIAAALIVVATTLLHAIRMHREGMTSASVGDSRLLYRMFELYACCLGASTCFGLMSYGWWRDDTWQPYGCVMHRYTTRLVRILKARMYIRDFIIGFCNYNLIVTCTLH